RCPVTRDLLREATRALSESGHEQKGARFTRERLMASLHERKQRSKSRFAVLLTLAAVFVGSTAFAAVTGKLEVLVSSALDVVGARSAQVEEPPATSLSSTQQSSSRHAPAEPSSAPAAPQMTREKPELPPDPSALEELERSEPPRHAVAKSPVRESDDAHAVYRRAHRAQFSQGDMASALTAYDTYLTLQPR